ncbi:Precorrin-8X methylmutase [Candidatus Hodgkinia cicadicola]|nr:Precorrin-8X methylmutase [Candidatus Hodgkinia cicadicola]
MLVLIDITMLGLGTEQVGSNLRWNKSIFVLSWNIAAKNMPQCCYRSITKYIVTRLRYCFGFDVIKYCFYSDGVFDLLASALSKNGVIITDTYALHSLLRNACRGMDVKIYCLSGLIKTRLLIGCAKSCVQLDLCIKLITLIYGVRPVIVVGTAPTTIFRILEISRPLLVVATTCGQINSSMVKRWVRFSSKRSCSNPS